jgi:hypothetical protein
MSPVRGRNLKNSAGLQKANRTSNGMRVFKLLSAVLVVLLLFVGHSVFAALPSTSNFKLNSYGFGSGGTANSSTGNYSLEGITGEIGGQTASTATYQTKPGYIETQQANVPKVTISNPSSYYDKLKFVIDEQNNPTDAKYALQIKAGDPTCDFGTGTIKYVKNDLTMGSSLTTADYQLYNIWGGSSGANIIGLSPNTTYCLRAKATQGNFTESGYGPSTSAATVSTQISFCTYSTSGVCGGSRSVSFGGLTAGNVTNSASNIGVDFATNADSGGNVYIYSAHGALTSTNAPSGPITSATANISSASQGYGAQIATVSQLTKVSPYNDTSNTVGILSTSVNTILTSSSPVVGGTSAIQLRAKPATTTPAATDYADTLTLIAAAAF